jgi:tetraacyldisaccharide 4'-kinase
MKRPLLLPLVPLYAAGLALREMRLKRGWEPVRRLRHPVISIGNLSTGGSGKTPLTIALARLLSARGLHVDVLSRGYGRSSVVPLCVDPSGSPDEYGDEPLLIAREAGAPVYVAPERYDAGQLAESGAQDNDARPRVHLLDDGFQHRQLARDIDILLVNREDWHDRLLLAGNLREPVQAARRASVLAIPAEDPAFETELRAWGWTGPIWQIHRRMRVPSIDGPVAAFCGIARPEQFFAGIEAASIRIATRTAFGDHHRYTVRELERLIAKARAAGATAFITTEKDRVRLGNLASAFPADQSLKTAPLAIEIEEESIALEWLTARLAASRAFASL